MCAESRAERDGPAPEPRIAHQVIGQADWRIEEFGLGLLFAVFALIAAFPPSGSYFLAWLTIPGWTLSSIHFLRRALDRRPRLEMDEEGIVDRTSIFGGTLSVPWSQVRGASLSKWYRGVQLEVADLDAIERTTGLGRRLGIGLGRMVGKRTLTLETALLGVSRSELRGRIEAALDNHERAVLGLSPTPRVKPPTDSGGHSPA